MDLRWLDDVLVLLEEGNLTRAAERRNVTQPAFSRRIGAFEDWLGTPILDRLPNRIEIGKALAANESDIRALATNLRELRANIAEFDPARSTIAIAAQHAPLISTFPDMALRARAAFPRLNFRLRAGNLDDCVTRFLRRDASMLLCYNTEAVRPLDFGPGVIRGDWGDDYLTPVVGGPLRHMVDPDGRIPRETPAICYPESSYFGDVLSRANRAFGTPGSSVNAICVTAFSSGAKELVLSGLGVGWVPLSMVHRELANGELTSLEKHLGRERLRVTVFADSKAQVAMNLLALWTQQED